MGHDKLRKFAENETFSCLLQPSAAEVLADGFDHLRDHPIKGHWFEYGKVTVGSVAPNNRCHPRHAKRGDRVSGGVERSETVLGAMTPAAPLILELGCGKGEYTLELARRNPDRNYVGVDIKGARLWRGAKTATEEGLPNVAFLRTRIEFITAYFAPGEVSEIWLTFSDPQPKSENNRLSSPLFLERYRSMLKPGGIVRLKTDSRFLHEYTRAVVEANGLKLLACTTDLYGEAGGTPPEGRATRGTEAGGPLRRSGGVSPKDELPKGELPAASIEPEVREVHTFYESMFLEQGVPITYLAFTIDREGPYVHPAEKFDAARWRELDNSRRSFGHGAATSPASSASPTSSTSPESTTR